MFSQLVLTAMEFPSFFFIALSQFTSTCFVISVLRVLGYIKVSAFSPLVHLVHANWVSAAWRLFW